MYKYLLNTSLPKVSSLYTHIWALGSDHDRVSAFKLLNDKAKVHGPMLHLINKLMIACKTIKVNL